MRRQLGLPMAGPLTVIAVHPVTLAEDTLEEIEALFGALEALTGAILFCFPNSDAGSRALIDRARAFSAARDGSVLAVNLPASVYLSALGAADLMIGNSSSGIMESPSFKLPAIDVGRRQEGRLAAANILRVPADEQRIRRAIDEAIAPGFREGLADLVNPYGDGTAGERIADILSGLPARDVLLNKPPAPVA